MKEFGDYSILCVATAVWAAVIQLIKLTAVSPYGIWIMARNCSE